jgi:hypothetical protein
MPLPPRKRSQAGVIVAEHGTDGAEEEHGFWDGMGWGGGEVVVDGDGGHGAGEKAFEEIGSENKEARGAAKDSEGVGSADITAAGLADIEPSGASHQVAGGYGTQQVGGEGGGRVADDFHCGDGARV